MLSTDYSLLAKVVVKCVWKFKLKLQCISKTFFNVISVKPRDDDNTWIKCTGDSFSYTNRNHRNQNQIHKYIQPCVKFSLEYTSLLFK